LNFIAKGIQKSTPCWQAIEISLGVNLPAKFRARFQRFSGCSFFLPAAKRKASLTRKMQRKPTPIIANSFRPTFKTSLQLRPSYPLLGEGID